MKPWSAAATDEQPAKSQLVSGLLHPGGWSALSRLILGLLLLALVLTVVFVVLSVLGMLPAG